MSTTLLLDIIQWDLVLDAKGDIALASDPYSLAQDAASAIKLFQGELWYDTTKGVPYWVSILGKFPPLQLIKNKLTDAALTVPGVVTAQCFISSTRDRVIKGQVQITDSSGATSVVSF